jgi:hypothetical protein
MRWIGRVVLAGMMALKLGTLPNLAEALLQFGIAVNRGYWSDRYPDATDR